MGSVNARNKGAEEELARLLERQSVLEKRLGDTHEIVDDTDHVGDAVDMANEGVATEMQAQLRGREVEELHRIGEAIEAIRSGLAGVCEDCGGKIAAARRAAIIGVRTCIECARKSQSNGASSKGSSKEHWSLVSDGGDTRDHLDQSDMVDD